MDLKEIVKVGYGFSYEDGEVVGWRYGYGFWRCGSEFS